MNVILEQKMKYAIQKYGKKELYLKVDEVLRKWPKDVIEYSIESDIDYYHMRESLMWKGRILEEDLVDGYSYISIITPDKLAMNDALLVVIKKDKDIWFGAYAHEGLIKQNNSRKALNVILSDLGIEASN